MPNFANYKLLEACRQAGCPVCRLEQQSVERYLDSQFYESVNSPAWRDHLRASLGFCHEHAWLAVDRRLGDALGFSIIYHDVVNSLLNRLKDKKATGQPSRRRASLLKRIPEPARHLIESLLGAFAPRKHCPACEHRDDVSRNILSSLMEELATVEMTEALQFSQGLCLPHLRLGLEYVKDASVAEKLIAIHRAKLESLKSELGEFIRKSDYQVIKEGFGTEGDAWLRAIGMVAGSRRGR